MVMQYLIINVACINRLCVNTFYMICKLFHIHRRKLHMTFSSVRACKWLRECLRQKKLQFLCKLLHYNFFFFFDDLFATHSCVYLKNKKQNTLRATSIVLLSCYIDEHAHTQKTIHFSTYFFFIVYFCIFIFLWSTCFLIWCITFVWFYLYAMLFAILFYVIVGCYSH